MNELTAKILKYLLLIFAGVLVISIVYHAFNQDYETETAVYAEVSDVSAFQGVFVRDETVQTYSGSGIIRYCVEDGAKLGVGSVIAEVYANEEQIDLRAKIAEKEDELALLTKVENPGISEYAQPANLAELIAAQYRELIRCREHGDFEVLSRSKRELTVLMSTYDKITGNDVQYAAQIAQLEEEIAQLNAKKVEPNEVIRASESAYFISYADGYESVLTTENLSQLTAEQLAQITNDGIQQSNEQQIIGKLVNGYTWYIVGVFDNTKLRLSEASRTKIRLESVSEALSVEVVSLVSAGDITKTLGVFRCEKMTEEVVRHRTERVEIVRDTISGVKVPREAIRFKELTETITDEETGASYEQTTNYMGVYVLVGESAEFRKLDIVYEEENYYLSNLDAGNGYVALYDDIIVNGVMADGN